MEVYDELEKALKEIDRLKNIIKEFENWLRIEIWSIEYNGLYRIGLQDSLDKLEELKRKK